MRLPRGQTYWRFSVAKAQSAPGSNLGFGNDTAARCRAVSLREVRLVYWTPLRVCGFSPGAKDFASFAVMWYGCRVFRVASVSCCCFFSFFLSFYFCRCLFCTLLSHCWHCCFALSPCTRLQTWRRTSPTRFWRQIFFTAPPRARSRWWWVNASAYRDSARETWHKSHTNIHTSAQIPYRTRTKSQGQTVLPQGYFPPTFPLPCACALRARCVSGDGKINQNKDACSQSRGFF